MKLTVRDVSNFPELSKLTLIAGRGGLGKVITHCGILDYEYDKDVANKYYDYNYQVDGGFLTLSTFLYAKKNPHLIYDAVKKLVSKNGSGLIIKNIFKLPISDSVIRYADYADFPIFILNDSYPFFEDIILLINRAMEKYGSVYYMEQKVNTLLTLKERDPDAVVKAVSDINPLMQDDILALYFNYNREHLSTVAYLDIEHDMEIHGVLEPESSVFLYKNGFMIILSSRHFATEDPKDILAPYSDFLNGSALKDFTVGVSKVHHAKENLIYAIKECIYASVFPEEKCSAGYTTFGGLGTYQAILPFINNSSMYTYCRSFIEPLESHDAEAGSDLLDTAVVFVKSSGDLMQSAQIMSQHKNTIRNRMNKVGQILSINPFSAAGYEKLALAIRIHICINKNIR